MSRSLVRSDKEITDIYERHVNMVYRVCFSFMKNTADTEDRVQDTFIQLISSDMDFQSEEHEKAWLIVTASNLCKNHLRHWWQKRFNIDDYENVATTQPFEIDETLAVVMALPDKYKLTLYLYYYEGYTSTEIARLMEKPQSTIRNYLHRGRNILREKLGGEINEE